MGSAHGARDKDAVPGYRRAVRKGMNETPETVLGKELWRLLLMSI